MNSYKCLIMMMCVTCVMFQSFAYKETTVNGLVWLYEINETKHTARLGYSEYKEVGTIYGNIGKTYHYPAISKSTQGDLKIPSQLNGYIVTSIGSEAFYSCEKITSVIIPDTVTSGINSETFYGCSGLTNVVIGTGVSSIGYLAFSLCTNLRTITIPQSVKSIDDWGGAFSGCKSLTNVVFNGDIPTGVQGSKILDCATSVRYRKKFAANYEEVIPANIFAGYSMLEDEEWLNIPDQIFSHCENAAWSGDYDVSHDSEGSMRSGAVENNGESWIETKVTGPVRLSFWWKASSEEYDGEVFDYAYLSLDGEPLGMLSDYQLQGIAIGGKTDWTNVVYDIMDAGEHTVRWTYKKDEVDESDVGEDCVWLDEVSLDPLVALDFDLNGGEGTAPTTIQDFARAQVSLPTATGFCKPKYTFIGWNDGTGSYAGGARYVVASSNVTFTAVWQANTLSAPVISSADVSDGGVLESASAMISIAAEKGANIHYTLDGSEPTSSSALYSGPFTADGLAVTIRAIAMRDNYFDSPMTSFAFTRLPNGLADSMNVEGWRVSTDVSAGWTSIAGAAAHDGIAAIRSGAVGDGESSSVEMTVLGPGEIGFWWKTSSEMSRNRKYDYVSFMIDDEEQSWLGGTSAWTNEVFAVEGEGTHTLKWVYQKNSNGLTGGEDCAWLDEVTWTPNDPLPEIAEEGEIKAALARARAEVQLRARLTTVSDYTEFRSWVDKNRLDHQTVKDALNAWFSYALDAPVLMAKVAPLASEDIVIESIAPSSTASGTFDLTVSIAGAEIGEEARLAEVLGIEGAAELKESVFSSDGLTVSLDRTADGNAKATVTPEGSPTSFFLRVKVK